MNTDFQTVYLVWGRSSVPRIAAAPVPQTVPEWSLPVPCGVRWLVVAPGRPPCIRSRRPARTAAIAIVEPLTTQQRSPRLLIKSIYPHRVRINGRLAPLLTVLAERDVFQLDGGMPLHVTVFAKPPIGTVSQDLVGQECPVCRVAFLPTSICYTCGCGASMHCEDDQKEDGLQCAQLRMTAGCPVCRRALILKAGFTYWPEGEENE
jgi:hypothetical protein